MDLKLPITFVQVKQCRVRLPGDAIEGPPEEWDLREQDWLSFWKSRGKEKLEKGGKAAVDGKISFHSCVEEKTYTHLILAFFLQKRFGLTWFSGTRWMLM